MKMLFRLFVITVISISLLFGALGCTPETTETAATATPSTAATSKPTTTPTHTAPVANPTVPPASATTTTPASTPAETSTPAATTEPGSTLEYEITYAIVDTGQDKCYNNSSAIAAPSEGSAFYGQDAQYEGNQPDYTISADGLTVYDSVTGLTWTQGADWTGDGVVDVNDKFTFNGAQTCVNTLNAQDYGGFSDWRVPSIKELYSLIDYRGTDPNPTAPDSQGQTPFINVDVFEFAYGDTSAGERIIDSQWVTSTLYVSKVMNNMTAMFGVNFADGRIKGYPVEMPGQSEGKLFYARFCRGNTGYGQNIFIDNGDGTISDKATGLMWSQSDSGEGLNWEDALAWVQQKNEENYLGYSDWRLPNAKELQSLVDYTRSPDTTDSAAIDALFESSQIIDEAGQKDYPFYWSSTSFLRFDGTANNAVYVSFGEGLGSMDNVNVIDVHGAGCQRSDPKDGNPNEYPSWGHGPQGDVQRVFNYVRCVRTGTVTGSQASTGTTTNSSGAQDEYTLFAPIAGTVAYLIDMDGNTVHQWELSAKPGLSVYLLEDKNLLATYTVASADFQGEGVNGGGIEILDWTGNQIWSYELADSTYHLHHDIEYLPDGNILAIAWEKKPASEAISAGVDGSYVNPYGEVWSEAIFEIDPDTNTIVWEWHAWDHLLPEGADATDYPELIDPNYPVNRQSADWLHINSVDYNEASDRILLSVHNTNEIWIIDHNTSTSEAAGAQGDLLYRWGNPEAYGQSGNQVLFGQHDAAWIDPASASSNVLLFNNGSPQSRPYSTVLELNIGLPYSYGAADIVWEYGDSANEESFFSMRISGAQRLANGNTLICSGVEARFFEVTPDGSKVWEYLNPYGTSLPNGAYINEVFRAERYSLVL